MDQQINILDIVIDFYNNYAGVVGFPSIKIFENQLVANYALFIKNQLDFTNLNYQTISVSMVQKICNEFLTKTIDDTVSSLLQNYIYLYQNNEVNTDNRNFNHLSLRDHQENETVANTKNNTNDSTNNNYTQSQNVNTDSTLNAINPIPVNYLIQTIGSSDGNLLNNNSQYLANANVNTVSTLNNGTQNLTSNNSTFSEKENNTRNRTENENVSDGDLLTNFRDGKFHAVYKLGVDVGEEVIDKFTLQFFVPFNLKRNWF